jgi:hypothetical protein
MPAFFRGGRRSLRSSGQRFASADAMRRPPGDARRRPVALHRRADCNPPFTDDEEAGYAGACHRAARCAVPFG